MKTVYWIILLAFIVVLSVAALIIFMPGQNATKAQIYSDGQVIRTVDLLVDQQFTVTSPTGGTNVITVKDCKIAVTEATCPDHYCMNRGFVSGGYQIICLPNQMEIRFLAEQEIDGIVG